MRKIAVAITSGLLALAVVGAATLVEQRPPVQAPAPGPPPATRADLFQTSRVWNLHLTFTANDWKALTPERTGTGGRRDGFLGPEGKRNGISAMNGLDFAYVHAALDLNGRRFADTGVRFKGNGTYGVGQAAGKISFKIDLNKFVKGQKLDGLSTLNLHSTITDASWMNETLAYRLYRDAGVPAPRTAYAQVFVTVPGRFTRQNFGLYTLVENIDSNFAVERFGVNGGAIFKPVTRAPFNDLGTTWDRYNQTYDPKTDLTPAEQQRIMEFCALVTRGSDAAFAARIGEFVDLPSFATYAAVLVWLANPDSILYQGQNYYLHLHPKTRRLSFIPWDQDHSFGTYPSGGAYQTLDIVRPWSGDQRFLDRIFRIEAFRTAYVAELRRLSKSFFQPDRFAQQVDALAPLLRPFVQQDPLSEYSGLFESAVAGRSFRRPHYGGTTVPIKPFAAGRTASVIEQLGRAR